MHSCYNLLHCTLKITFQIRTITQVFSHPAYNHPSYLNNDFAMFRFSPPVEYNECVAPICLPEQGYVFEPMIDTYAIGWGNLHCKILEHVCSFIKRIELLKLVMLTCSET